MRQSGFSLLETLAALALLAMLLLGVTAAVQTMTHSTHATVAATERLDQIRAAQQYVRRALSGSLAYPWALRADKHPIVLRGTADDVTFVAPGPGYLAKSGLQLQRLALVGEGKEKRLEAAFAPLAAREAAQVVPSAPEVLVDRVISGHFVYSGIDGDGKPVAWQPTWPYEDHLPTMIGLELTLAGGTGWPTIAVPLRMDPTAVNGREAMARLTMMDARP
ncbi:general secretion pathway protein J [Luteibacter sp. UNCMF331Sha3.1]|uniref:prepilin-type N-terminal cleavage/methylation domain-containing protein n=1 Tax=Luteibacter sp. UNCMF331Sha3.1 TaxID=1502760 RepID=UPI0008D36DE1|nr:prepilin-type N-terminal cleavage/methylation domain-containing protein [Luteibacter sp. UNCMF331Sha3.1]SEN07378.1 general secretion pathway protein J [Luteibacter sp. UNCMF331Sha3.1]